MVIYLLIVGIIMMTIDTQEQASHPPHNDSISFDIGWYRVSLFPTCFPYFTTTITTAISCQLITIPILFVLVCL
jgi:hypothetical protein